MLKKSVKDMPINTSRMHVHFNTSFLADPYFYLRFWIWLSTARFPDVGGKYFFLS